MNVYKAFLCFYFKVHVSKTSSVADHCRRFDLSDTKDEDYKDICDHVHNGLCDRCDLVQRSVCDVEEVMSHVTTTTEELEELKFIVEQAKSSILVWKAHLLRSVNQDEARVDAVEELSKYSVLLVLGNEVLATSIQREPDQLVCKARDPLAHNRGDTTCSSLRCTRDNDICSYISKL